MKTILLSMLLIVASLTTLTTTTFAQKSGDEAAILKILTDSRTAFDKRDATTMFNYFIKSPNLYYQVYDPSGKLIMANGWEAMTHMVGDYIKNHPEPAKGKYTRSDTRVHINGNTAWASGNGETVMGNTKAGSREFFVLNKQAGQWKIAALIVQDYAKENLIVVK